MDTPALTIYNTKDRIPIRCSKTKFGSEVPCNKTVKHTVANISHAMKNPDVKGNICCQGECDSSNKNKDKRKGFETFTNELAIKAKGEWVLLPNQVYRTSSQKYWFTHKCRFNIYIEQNRLINSDVNSNGVHSCPCCDRYLPLKLINDRVDMFQKWLDVLTNSKLEYLSPSIPTSSTEEMSFRCRDCNSPFTGKLQRISSNKYCGCNTCFEKAKNNQRVQAMDSGCEIRRGFTAAVEITSVNQVTSWSSLSGEIFTGSLIELCKKYPVRTGGISKALPNEDFHYVKHGQPYSEDDLSLLHKLANTMPYKDMSKHLKRTPDSIKRKFEKLGIRNDLMSNYKRLTKLNDTVFNEVTPESAYWAGLLAADGCINQNGRYFSLELQAKDEMHLGRLLEYLESDGKITYRTIKEMEGRNIYSAINVSSIEIIEALHKNFNLIPAKSLTIEPPLIENIQHREAFMLGLFDGDGNISRKSNGQLVVGFTTASYKIAYWYLEEVKRILDKKEHSISSRTKENSNIVRDIRLHSQEASRFLSKLYSAVDLGLERKYKIYSK